MNTQLGESEVWVEVLVNIVHVMLISKKYGTSTEQHPQIMVQNVEQEWSYTEHFFTS